MGPGVDGDQGLSKPSLHGRPRLQLGLLLSGPLGWLGLAYLGSLAVLFAAAFWHLDSFSGEVVRGFSFQNFQTLWESDVYRTIALRTIAIAAAVTVTDVADRVPDRVLHGQGRLAGARATCSLVAVLMPLWSSYLVKVYAWRTILAEEGILNWVLAPFGLHGPGFGNVATWLVFSYLWLPYMIIPLYAGLERIPDSLLDASGDLGGKPGTTAAAGDPPARAAGDGGGLDLHLLADARRLHHARTSSRARSSSATSSTRTSASPTTSRSPRRSPRCRCS